jgi:hypothetical protein
MFESKNKDRLAAVFPKFGGFAVVLSRPATALNQPINTVADCKEGETRTSDRPRRATCTSTISIIAILLAITGAVTLGVG